MAKNHRKGNREARKAPSAKPKPVAQVSQFERGLTSATLKKSGGGKKPPKS